MKSRFLISAFTTLALAATTAKAENGSTFIADETNPRSGEVSRFSPSSSAMDHQIDYKHWDEALGFFVVPMGPSLRDGANRVEPQTGTRLTYGHTSRYRLEGNRVAFSLIGNETLEAITAYRLDLERIATQLDITRLPRNEQLAYWINLHNVAVVEALAGQYPLRDPAEGTFGSNQAPLQDALLVNVNGVELSPRDIREKIVYPNWKDPKVIYGFWRGEIGGPSIQRLAFTGSNVDVLLSIAAEEFVNSLRGVEKLGQKLQVSEIYEEAAPFYFSDDNTLRAHLSKFARDDVANLISKRQSVAYAPYESDIADLLFGKGDPGLDTICSLAGGAQVIPGIGVCADQPTRPNRAAQRLMKERAVKLARANRQGIRTGTVIFGDGRYSESDAPREVK